MNKHDIDLIAAKSAPYRIAVSFEVRFINCDVKEQWLRDNLSNFFVAESIDRYHIRVNLSHLSKDAILDRALWEKLMESFRGIAELWDASRPLHIFIERSSLKNPEVDFAKLWYFYEYIMRGDALCDNVFSRSRNAFRGTSQIAQDVEVLGNVLLNEQELRELLLDDMLKESKHASHCDIMCFNESSDVSFLRPRASSNVARVIAQIDLFDLMLRYAAATPIQNMSKIDFLYWLKYQKVTKELKSWLGW